MTRSPLPALALLATLAVVIAACGESNAPGAVPASYLLATYGGAPLPVVLRRIVETSTQPGGPTVTCDDKLVASNLRLATGRYTQTDSHLVACDDGRPDATNQSVVEGRYTAGADTLVLEADVSSDTRYVSLARLGSGALTIYQREARSVMGATTIDPTVLVFRAEPK